VSTRTEEINTAVKGLGETLADASATAERLTESAREKTESASAHGWGGVAENMQEAVDHLEGVVEQLGTASTAVQSAVEALDAITEKMSSPEVVEQLGAASSELESLDGALEAAVGQVDEAVTACEAAGQTSLPERMQTLREEIGTVQEKAGESRGDVQTESQEAQTWTDATDDEDDS
jgi:molecular chaperone GrpE (heat shock protein)